MNKVTKGVLIGCGSVLLLNVIALIAIVFYVRHAFETALDPVQDLDEYTDIKSMWSTTLVDHFPATVADQATFYYQPGFLQGGSVIQLKRTVSSTVMSNIWQFAMTNAVATFQGGSSSDHRNLVSGVPTTYFYTSGSDELYDFPKDYTIIVIVTNDFNGGFAWNHGQTAGFAISTQRNTVVYWAEDW